MTTFVTTRPAGLLLVATFCAFVGVSCCAVIPGADQLAAQRPFISEAAVARLEAAEAIGIPAADVGEIEAALEDLRGVDAAAHAEMSDKWDRAIADLKKTGPQKWSSLRPLYLSAIKRRHASLARSSENGEAGEDDTGSVERSLSSQDDKQNIAAIKKKRRAARALAKKRRLAASRAEESRTEEKRQAAKLAAIEREKNRRAGKYPADAQFAANDVQGWFFNSSEKDTQYTRRFPVKQASFESHETDEPSYQSERRSRQDDRPARDLRQPAKKSAESYSSYDQEPSFDEEPSSEQERPLSDDNRSAEQQWRDQLAGTIRRLEAQIEAAGEDDDTSQDEAKLRLLYLAAGQHDAAVRPVSSTSADEQEFWSNQLYGLSLMLDDDRSSNVSRRATEAIAELRKANQHLGAMADLVVSNMTFCRRVVSFGIYEEFDDFEFTPGQITLVYVELDNYRSEETVKGKRLAFGGSYQIFDDRGHTWADRELGEYEEHAQHARRDFFMHYRITMPQQLPPGEYTLQLSIEDQVSHQIAQSQMRFQIAGANKSRSPATGSTATKRRK